MKSAGGPVFATSSGGPVTVASTLEGVTIPEIASALRETNVRMGLAVGVVAFPGSQRVFERRPKPKSYAAPTAWVETQIFSKSVADQVVGCAT
ncbi:MAG: hypothetical protein ACLQVL_08185 [Terriglobia bacterium]